MCVLLVSVCLFISLCRAYEIWSLQDINGPMIANKNPKCRMITTLLFITSVVSDILVLWDLQKVMR